MIIGRQFTEKLYSENQEERLYSTGNDELDELLERAFCEGYELGQKEFGNKENKAAKRKYELEKGKNVRGVFEDFNSDNLTNDENNIRRFRIKRRIDNEPDVKNVDQAINYRSDFASGNILDKISHDKNQKDRDIIIEGRDKSRQAANKVLYDKDSNYRKKLKFNNTKRKVNKFVKDNKVALGLGGAALVGGGAYLIHRHNKKKKEAEKEKNQDK